MLTGFVESAFPFFAGAFVCHNNFKRVVRGDHLDQKLFAIEGVGGHQIRF